MKVAKAKAEGRLRGRQPRLSASRQEHLVKLYDDEEKNAVEWRSCSGSGAPPCTERSRGHWLRPGGGTEITAPGGGCRGEGMVREAVENMAAPGSFSGLIYRL